METVTRLVLGFLFDPDLRHVVLLNKTKTPYKTAMGWNGLGGHIEGKESEVEGLSREVEEESGISIPTGDWYFAGGLYQPEAYIGVFTAISVEAMVAVPKTEEMVQPWPVEELPKIEMASFAEAMVYQCRDKMRSVLGIPYRPFAMGEAVRLRL